MNQMQRIRAYYGIPAKRGGRVSFRGQPGTITSATRNGMHLRIRLDDDPARTVRVHPTWEMEYLEKTRS